MRPIVADHYTLRSENRNLFCDACMPGMLTGWRRHAVAYCCEGKFIIRHGDLPGAGGDMRCLVRCMWHAVQIFERQFTDFQRRRRLEWYCSNSSKAFWVAVAYS
nr:hypothetical protein Iba_chr08bCG10230 [Ipomoea batatas]